MLIVLVLLLQNDINKNVTALNKCVTRANYYIVSAKLNKMSLFCKALRLLLCSILKRAIFEG